VSAQNTPHAANTVERVNDGLTSSFPACDVSGESVSLRAIPQLAGFSSDCSQTTPGNLLMASLGPRT